MASELAIRNVLHSAREYTTARWLALARALSSATVATLAASIVLPASAHHSYAMFDMSKSIAVQGTVAKIEWVNPHVFVWVYVATPDQPGKYDLYGFENGPIGMLTRYGWSKDSLAVGEKITVQYFPLRDGRTGGYFIKATHADGKEHLGDPFAPGVVEAAKRGPGALPPPGAPPSPDIASH